MVVGGYIVGLFVCDIIIIIMIIIFTIIVFHFRSELGGMCHGMSNLPTYS